ncbi:hypothetical protein [Alicyclobacillus dauci]|uniref:CBS domain-containing protein n=1 Tax=Alicyclobacillus dauci TaxID=1475485 RepID=A0ABY6YZ56_9BACL|nr:hypothetical protein [Alicyclobacillus dauci]WAH35899.1 hypothetical protein NZD86_16735 [Alicyclobacillus dauci]
MARVERRISLERIGRQTAESILASVSAENDSVLWLTDENEDICGAVLSRESARNLAHSWGVSTSVRTGGSTTSSSTLSETLTGEDISFSGPQA